MNKLKGYCDVCSVEIEVTMCCSGHECGCMGLPTEPTICSEKCYDIFMSEEYRKEKEAEKSIAFFIPKKQ